MEGKGGPPEGVGAVTNRPALLNPAAYPAALVCTEEPTGAAARPQGKRLMVSSTTSPVLLSIRPQQRIGHQRTTAPEGK